MENKNYLTIGKLSSYSGIHIKALRYYESIGILHPALIDANNGYRYYSHAHIPYVKIIKLCADYGIPLGTFNDFIKSDTEINLIKIIRKASNILELKEKQLLIKVAREDEAGNTIPLLPDQLTALAYYVSEFEATGDKINIVNYNPDILLLQFDVCYDPLVLNANGMNKITAKFPVKDAILAYMKNLPFDGELSVQKLEEVILNTDGVTDLLRKQVSSKWIDSSINDYGQFQPISIAKIPKSGHFKIEDWSGLNYIIKQPQE